MGMIIMNGKEYASSPKDGFPPIIYSDEEREIGVWRDGKPLYQKSYSVNLPSSFNVSGGFLIDNDISYIDVLADGFGSGVSPEGYIASMGGLASVSGWRFNLHRNPNNQLILYVGDTDNHLKNGKVHITIQYTKTTDIPGSGKYTTYGGLTHHYSTTEQVVGTWVDGKPLYERTFALNSLVLDNWDNVAHGISNIDTLCRCESTYYRTTGVQTVPMPFYESASYYAICLADKTYIAYYIKGYGSGKIIVTLQYTKTTD